MRLSSVAMLSLVVASLAACSASFDEPGDVEVDEGAAQASSDVTTIEKNFGLTRDRQSAGKWSRDLASGDCYRTYWQKLRTPLTVVRFTKGAAYLRASAGGGSQAPVLCLDLDAPRASLDGPALDAVLRHDLGGLTATVVTPAGQGTHTFARGMLRFNATGTIIGPSADVVASSLAMGASPERLRAAHFIGGQVVQVVVKGTTVFDELERVPRRFDLSLSGQHATFDWLLTARRAAPRSADSLGRFQRSSFGADGPVASTGLFFERGTTFELLDGSGRNGVDLETSFVLYPPGVPGAPLVGKPLVECVHSSTFGGDGPSPPAKLRCTGL